MIKISKDNEHETTIIITTHYIEEARQADMVSIQYGPCHCNFYILKDFYNSSVYSETCLNLTLNKL
jgi:ABC-type multidrug transport system ATPase subunit